MDWTVSKDGAAATSSFHDDGSPFLYFFTRCANGWNNETDTEIVSTPTLPVFSTLDAAMGWAERNEASMNAIHEKREAAAPTPPATAGEE